MSKPYLLYNNKKFVSNKPLIWRGSLDPTKKLSRAVEYDNEISATDQFSFALGRKLDLSKNYDLKFISKRMGEKRIKKYDFIANDSSSPLVTRKVVDILTDICPNEFQAVRAIIGKKNKETNEYIPYDVECYMINLLYVVDGIDVSRSKFIEPNEIDSIYEMSLLQNCLGNLSVARLKHLQVKMIASQRLVNIFSNYKLQGMHFIEPEELYSFRRI